MSLAVVSIALVVVLSWVSLGGGLYEAVVIDPVWPGRPAIVQPRNGGVSRTRYWVPVHTALEVALVIAVIAAWSSQDVRLAVLIALASHVVLRVWSLADLTPRSAAFEKADPATVDRTSARRWTRRNLFRLPLDVITGVAALVALVQAT